MKGIKFLVFFLVCFAGAYFAIENIDDLKRFKSLTLPTFLLLILLDCAGRLVSGCRIKIVARVNDANLVWWEWLGLSIINSFYNYLFTKSGMLANAVYMKKKHAVSAQKFLATFASIHLITLLIGGFIGLSVAFFAELHGYKSESLIILFLCIFIGTGVPVFFPRVKLSSMRFFKKLHELFEGWSIIRHSGKYLFILFLYEFFIIGLQSFRYSIAFSALGYAVPFWVCLLTPPVNTLLHIIGLTPGGLGIREAGVGLMTDVLGFGLQAGILATALNRCVSMVITFIFGPMFSYILSKNVRANYKQSSHYSGL